MDPWEVAGESDEVKDPSSSVLLEDIRKWFINRNDLSDSVALASDAWSDLS